jgi:hypothetical protein
MQLARLFRSGGQTLAVGDAPQLVDPAVGEFDPGAGDEVSDRLQASRRLSRTT